MLSKTRSTRAPDRVVATAELDPQCDHDPRDVAAAVDRVAAGHHDQCGDRVGLSLDRPGDLPPPGLFGPRQGGQDEVR
jgi:hypothetical protein